MLLTITNISGGPVTIQSQDMVSYNVTFKPGQTVSKRITDEVYAYLEPRLTILKTKGKISWTCTIPQEMAVGSSFDMDVYIDGINGSDSNEGTLAKPLLTLDGFTAKFPTRLFNGARIRVNLAGTGGFGANATGTLTYTVRGIHIGGGGEYNMSIVYRGPQMVRITPATGTATPTLTGTPQQQVDQTNAVNVLGRRTKLNFTAPGWTVNDLRDKLAWVRITRAGNLVTFEFPITDNDADAVYIDACSTSGAVLTAGTILATDTVEIVTPAAIITGDPAANNGSAIVISGASGGGSTINFEDSQGQTFERITFNTALTATNVGGLGFDRCGFNGTDASMRSCPELTLLGCKSRVGTFYFASTASNFYASRRDSSVSPPSAMRFFQSALVVVNGGRLYIGSARGGLLGRWVCTYNLCVTGCTAVDAIHIDGAGSFLYMLGTLTGRNNTSYGLNTRYGAQAIVGGGQLSTITAATNDMRLDKNPGINWGTGAGQFEEAIGFNGNYHLAGGSTPTVPLGDLSRISKLNP